MFVVRVGDRGSVIWYGPLDVTVLPNSLSDSTDSSELASDVEAVLRAPSSPLSARPFGAAAAIPPLRPGTAEHALEALLSLAGAQLMHADSAPPSPAVAVPRGARRSLGARAAHRAPAMDRVLR